MVNENSIEIESSFIMRGSRPVLVEMVLFQLDGYGNPQDDTPSLLTVLKSSPLGISNEMVCLRICWKSARMYNSNWEAKNIWSTL